MCYVRKKIGDILPLAQGVPREHLVKQAFCRGRILNRKMSGRKYDRVEDGRKGAEQSGFAAS